MQGFVYILCIISFFKFLSHAYFLNSSLGILIFLIVVKNVTASFMWSDWCGLQTETLTSLNIYLKI